MPVRFFGIAAAERPQRRFDMRDRKRMPMPKQAGKERERIYQAPARFTAVFYGLLVLWTVGTLPFVVHKFFYGGLRGHWLYAFMIGFFYLFTWYWSLGLFYRITLYPGGRIRLKSFRRTLETTAQQVREIEGSRFAGGFGFIRIKLPRESAYLFCHRRTTDLDGIIRDICRINPMIKTVRI